jgi:pilus assembly protein Flp/PilA
MHIQRGIYQQIVGWLVARLNISSQRGATAVEYGIMVTLIAATVLLAVVFLGQRTSSTFSCTARAVSTKASVSGCS